MLWDVVTGKLIRVFTGHTANIGSVMFSPDGRYFVSGGWDGTARLWDVATGHTVRVLSDHLNEVGGIAFSPDGHYVLVGGCGKGKAFDCPPGVTYLWDVTSGQVVRSLIGFLR